MRRLEWHVARNILECVVDDIGGRWRPQGYEWELHRDAYVDEVVDGRPVDEVAGECLKAWHDEFFCIRGEWRRVTRHV